MGMLPGFRAGPSPSPKATEGSGHNLTPAAKQYLDRAVQLSKQSTSGPITPENSAELRKLAMKLTPDDLRSMRYNSADTMRRKLMPLTQDADPAKRLAASNLINVIDKGILPGMGENGVWIESGKPATREEVLTAKGPQPNSGAKKVWQP